MMLPPLPDDIVLRGRAVIRAMTLVLPATYVRSLLAPGMELREQALTPAGTHPVVLVLQHMFDGHMNIPSLLPPLRYDEAIWIVPHLRLLREPLDPSLRGPFCHLPRLFLNDPIAVLGGRLFWGLSKDFVSIVGDGRRHDVRTLDGMPICSFDFEPAGDQGPLDRYPKFEPMREIMSQPMLSLLPVGVGPAMVFSHFDKDWAHARVRPISAVVRMSRLALPGIADDTRFPPEGRTKGVDRVVLGSVEIECAWTQSLVRPC